MQTGHPEPTMKDGSIHLKGNGPSTSCIRLLKVQLESASTLPEQDGHMRSLFSEPEAWWMPGHDTHMKSLNPNTEN